MAQYLLTSIIPVGNLKETQENLLNIIRATYLLPIQVVIVLDSQPTSQEDAFCESVWSEPNENISVISGKWKNPGGARNYGMQNARSKWVTFWDSDDHPFPNKVLDLISELEKNQKDIGVGGFQVSRSISGNSSKSTQIEKSTNNFDTRILANPGIWRFVFKTELAIQVKFPEKSCAEDQLFIQRILWMKPEIYESDSTIYEYVVGGDSQLTKNADIAKETLEVVSIGLSEFTAGLAQCNQIIPGLMLKQLASSMRHGNFLEVCKSLLMVSKIESELGIRKTIKIARIYLQARESNK